MSNGITLKILGDFGPFSRVGKSVGYQVSIGETKFLIDCGAPLFKEIGGHGLKEINGIIVTHCHGDHQRWFTDLALFHMYAPDFPTKVSLFTSEIINDELSLGSIPALGTSLSKNMKDIIDVPYEDYIDFNILGPRSQYRIVAKDEDKGKSGLYIMDRNENVIGSDRAKIVINKKTNKPRMLFKDPDYGEWIEPESFYPFNSNNFYEENKNIHYSKDGFTIEAINAPVWHGIPNIGVKISTRNETLIFSSDTVSDIVLWKQLYSEKRNQRFTNISKKEFDNSSVIYGDINDFIERKWSEERFKEAITTFDDAIVVHDISTDKSVVHTNYNKLSNSSLIKDNTILTHCPDRMTSEWVLSKSGKTFQIQGNKYYDKVGDKLYPMNADVYHKEFGKSWVGYKNENGKYLVYDRDGTLGLAAREDKLVNGAPLYNVDLYQDISGKYYEKLYEKNSIYFERKDGKVELIQFTENGSHGKIIDDRREMKLAACKKNPAQK